jgi:hypothetical protein
MLLSEAGSAASAQWLTATTGHPEAEGRKDLIRMDDVDAGDGDEILIASLEDDRRCGGHPERSERIPSEW